MHQLVCKFALILGAFSLSACAHIVNTLDHVKVGMDREQAISSANGSPTPYYINKGEATEYVLFCVVTNLFSMSGEYPNDILFIRLENGKVVSRGVVGTSEEKRIRKLNPKFVLREWQRDGRAPDEQYDP